VNLELVGIENDVVEAVVFVDLDIDRNGTLVPELSTEFEIVEGKGVVRWLDPMICR
jgi:hypothetical protein